MPLTDLVRHLNARSAVQHPDRAAPFLAENGQVYGQLRAPSGLLTLASDFLPILETATGRRHGHAARLVIDGEGQDDDFTLFTLAKDNQDYVYLDRLIRTLHALNYLLQPQRGNLLLKVHPRHVLAVEDNHGLAFEEILRPCGLVPDQITLELTLLGNPEKLAQAAASYRQRGYGIALSQSQQALPWPELQPDIVRLEPAQLDSLAWLGQAATPFRDSGALLLASSRRPLRPGDDDWRALTGIDLLQTPAIRPERLSEAARIAA